MSLILCIETASTMCSVALGRDGKVIASKELNSGYTHAENLTLFIEHVLQEAKVEMKQLDAIAVSKGPGSYTGLRIGVSSAKGLCYGLERPLIGISTLYSMFTIAQKQQTTNPVVSEDEPNKQQTLYCPMLDARRMEVYCAVYDENGKIIKDVSADIIDANSFSDLLNENKTIFFGDGAAKCREALDHHDNAFFIPDVFPSATAMVALAEEKYLKKEFEDVAYFEPFYLKDFVGVKQSERG